MALEPDTVTANGLEFAHLAAGPSSGPLALRCHGFPDTAWTYRHLRPALGGDVEGVEIVEGAGHFLHLERPDEVNRRILGFVTA